MSATDLSHPSLSMEYTPLDPQASVGETKLQDLLQDTPRTEAGPIDYIAHSRHAGDSW